MVLNADDKNIAQTDNWTEAEDTGAITRFGISPNHLLGIKAEETTTTTTTEPTTKEAETAAPDETTTVDLTAPENSPKRKRTKNINVLSSIKESNWYTTKSFSIATMAHSYDHPCTFVEAAITLTK